MNHGLTLIVSLFYLVQTSFKEFGEVGLNKYTSGIWGFHKNWSGSLAERRLYLGPAGVMNFTPLSPEWVCFPKRVATTQPPSWHPSWPDKACNTRKDSESEWLAKGNPETNPITIKPEAASHAAELFSWVPLPYCFPPGYPFPIKPLASSACVSPWTVHFRVLDESPVSGPGRGPPSCNSSTSRYRSTDYLEAFMPYVSHSCTSKLVRVCSFHGNGRGTRSKPCFHYISKIHKYYGQIQKSRMGEDLCSAFLVAEAEELQRKGCG